MPFAGPKTFVNTDGTDLLTHDADWTYSWGGSIKINSDAAIRTFNTGFSTAAWDQNGSLSSADYEVEIKFVHKDSAPGAREYACAVARDPGTGAGTNYLAYHFQSDNFWRLQKCILGTFSLLGELDATSDGLTTNTEYDLKIRVEGTTIELFKLGEGTAAISVTDSSITDAGYPGFRVGATEANDNNKSRVTWWQASYLTASSTSLVSDPQARRFAHMMVR